ncbi:MULTISPECIES: SusE domain-containing protein [Niastella]|uniref:SusE domain-containing protein n=1 Tax=Niastella soli TaxID=2821487 RepID=A0ABS3Z278_9BACT|nr:SusE domain-containing protein [Niastella soli]MBO9204276.1 SusE domain-containing protein [Niastella soli]
MRKIFILCAAWCAGLALMLAACNKTGSLTYLGNGIPGSVTASSTKIVLDISKMTTTDTSVLFTIKNANFGYDAAIANELQFDSVGDNWAKPQSVTLNAGATTLSYTTYNLNALALKLGLHTNAAGQVLVRLKSTLSTITVFSDAVTLTVTPFSAASSVFVPGAYQGWNPASADSLVSETSNGIYTGVINFTGSDLGFKITTAKNWTAAYGQGSTAGTVSLSGGNLTAPGNGGYLLTLNTDLLTLTFTPQWSVIGDAAGGWSADSQMYLDKTNNTWYVTTKLKSDGTNTIKFRFKNDWGTNLGAGAGAGTLSSGGSNIIIPATAAGGDNYKITINPTGLTYTLLKI